MPEEDRYLVTTAIDTCRGDTLVVQALVEDGPIRLTVNSDALARILLSAPEAKALIAGLTAALSLVL